MREDARDGWAKILVMAAALTLLAVDTSSIPGWSSVWFRALYALSAVGLVVWRMTHHRNWLVLFGATFTTAAAVRACVLAGEGDRWSGVATNVLLAMFAFGFVRNRHDTNGEHPCSSLS